MQPVFLRAPNITCTHAFSTRHGGVSQEPFGTLNLGGTDDVQEHINENRRRFITALGCDPQRVARLHQVHGVTVCTAKPGVQTGDALVTNEKNLVLAIGAADCYPILFHDPVNHIIGAAHAGWKGTLGKIAQHTINAMVQLGADVQVMQVAIGQGICAANYEVSEEVITQFREAGFPSTCWNGRQLDLLACNTFVLQQAGVPATNCSAINRCTTEPDFFSYRRDNGVTGRMWGVIALQRI